LPANNIPLVAPVAQMLVAEETHPAIQAILLEAASDIHGESSLLATAGTFPDVTLTDVKVSPEAKRYFENGPSALRRWFSFGMANFLERAWVLAIPLLTLMIPMIRVAPPIYRWRVRRRIYVWYSDLRDLEAKGRSAKTEEERLQITRQLDQLQAEVGKVDVPLSYTDDLYRLRSHIEFVEGLILRLNRAASIA
ncbi:MAG: TRAP transporter substrate-binding protein, partial [Pseudomonadota bacterium]